MTPKFRLLLFAAPLLLGGCTQSPVSTAVATNPDTPGATGRTIVVGNNSTVASNAEATEQQQKWPVGRGR